MRTEQHSFYKNKILRLSHVGRARAISPLNHSFTFHSLSFQSDHFLISLFYQLHPHQVSLYYPRKGEEKMAFSNYSAACLHVVPSVELLPFPQLEFLDQRD